MSILLHFPPPVPLVLPDDVPVDLCEFDSVVMPAATVKWLPPSWLPPSRPISRSSNRHNSQMSCLELSSSAARDAFLSPKAAVAEGDDGPAAAAANRRVRKALTIWFEEGWFTALEQLATSPGEAKVALWQRCLASLARSVLGVVRISRNIHSSINPHITMSGSDLIAQFSETRDWHHSAIRCLKWHPHTPKFAVALGDDSIEVYGSGLPSSSTPPLLKYKHQRGISCLEWRPLNASELAVGCLKGILIWTVDPSSVAARPSAGCVRTLRAPGHEPVNSLQWDPNGMFLLSSSSADTSMLLWNTSQESYTPLRRMGGGGVHLVTWSQLAIAGPGCSSVLAATTSTTFRIWQTRTWTSDRWNVLKGHVQSACWSPDGLTLFFASSMEPTIFALNSGSSGSAVPVADVSSIFYDTGEDKIQLGGPIQCLRLDPLGERLAVTFQKSEVVAIFSVGPGTFGLTPVGLIRPQLLGENPGCIDFAERFDEGALLTIGWSSGRLQHVPLLFVPNLASSGSETTKQQKLSKSHLILSPEPEGLNFGTVCQEKWPELYSTPSG